MGNGVAQPKAPNTAAPVSGIALKGKRTNLAQVGRNETMKDRKVNTKSSSNTANLSAQNQKRNG